MTSCFVVKLTYLRVFLPSLHIIQTRRAFSIPLAIQLLLYEYASSSNYGVRVYNGKSTSKH